MTLENFIEGFKKLKGKNEFDPDLYKQDDGIHGKVSFNGGKSSVSAEGKLNLVRSSIGICAKVNGTYFEFVSPGNVVGWYYIDAFEPSETVYGFTIRNEENHTLKVEVVLKEDEYDSPY